MRKILVVVLVIAITAVMTVPAMADPPLRVVGSGYGGPGGGAGGAFIDFGDGTYAVSGGGGGTGYGSGGKGGGGHCTIDATTYPFQRECVGGSSVHD